MIKYDFRLFVDLDYMTFTVFRSISGKHPQECTFSIPDPEFVHALASGERSLYFPKSLFPMTIPSELFVMLDEEIMRFAPQQEAAA